MNKVDIWKIPLDAAKYDLSACFTALDAKEQARAQRFVFEHIRQRFIMSHYALRKILGDYLALKPEAIHYEFSQRNKPFVADAQNPNDLQFNLSHSQDFAIVGITHNVSIGVDVEYREKTLDYLALAQRFFAKEEIESLLQLEPSEQRQGFFNCWTRKEAFIKAIGQGLHYSLKKFAVSLTPGQPAHIIRIEPELANGNQWTLCGFEPQSDYVAAFACQQTVDNVEYMAMKQSFLGF